MSLYENFLPLLTFAALFRDDATLAETPFDTVRADVDRLFAAADKASAAYPPALVEEARFAACAFVDEALLLSAWREKNRWASATLQRTRCGTINAGVEFYTRCEALLAKTTPLRLIDGGQSARSGPIQGQMPDPLPSTGRSWEQIAPDALARQQTLTTGPLSDAPPPGKPEGIMDYLARKEATAKAAALSGSSSSASAGSASAGSTSAAAFRAVSTVWLDGMPNAEAASGQSGSGRAQRTGLDAGAALLQDLLAIHAACLALGFTGQYYSEAARDTLYKLTLDSLDRSLAGRIALHERRLTPEVYRMPPQSGPDIRRVWLNKALWFATPAVATGLIYLAYEHMLTVYVGQWLNALR